MPMFALCLICSVTWTNEMYTVLVLENVTIQSSSEVENVILVRPVLPAVVHSSWEIFVCFLSQSTRSVETNDRLVPPYCPIHTTTRSQSQQAHSFRTTVNPLSSV